MGKYKPVVVVIVATLIATVTLGFSFKTTYLSNKFDSKLLVNNNFDTNLSLIFFIEDFYRNQSIYENYEELTKNLVQVVLIDKQLIGIEIVASVEVTKVFISNQIKVGDKLQIVEPYQVFKNRENYVENSNAIYIPLYQGNDYVVNILESEFMNDSYEYLTQYYSCIPINLESTEFVISDDMQIDQTMKSKHLKFLVDTQALQEKLLNILQIDCTNFDELFKMSIQKIEDTLERLTNNEIY